MDERPASHQDRAKGLTRRRALRVGTVAAAGLVASGVLGACSVASRTAASPTRGSGKIVLLWRDWLYTTTQTAPLMYEGTAPFREKYPSIDIKPVILPQLGGMVPAMLAGNGPDVFCDWVLPPYLTTGQALNLAPYITRDNVDLSIFPTHTINFLRQAATLTPGTTQGISFLPCFIHTETTVVNLSMLDHLGFPYPEDGADWNSWVQWWTNWTQTSTNPKNARYGAVPDWFGYNDSTYNFPSPYILKGFGGGYVDPADATKSLLQSQGSITAVSTYVDLINHGVMGLGLDWVNDFTTGQLVSSIRPDGAGLLPAVLAWRGLNWRFFSPPVFPNARTQYSATDSYGIWSGTKYPEQSWEFLKWLAVDPTWSDFMVKLQLRGPAIRSVWNNWVAQAAQVAPPLANTNVQALADGPLNDYVYPGHLFAYGDAQVRGVIASLSNEIMTKHTSPATAMPQAASQIEAIQEQYAVSGQKAAQANQALQTTKIGQDYPAPPRTGAETANVVKATAAASLVSVGAGGVYTLTGDGLYVAEPLDNCVFAGWPTTKSVDSFSCRLTLLANDGCPYLAGWALAGLMARGDLTNGAPMTLLGVSGAYGVASKSRLAVGGLPVVQLAGTRGKGGLLPAAKVTKPNRQTHSNYLTGPIWLKLSRQGTVWQAQTSSDGTHWTNAGNTVNVAMPGAWVGVFATAHNYSFGSVEGQQIRAVFDHITIGSGSATAAQIGTAYTTKPKPAKPATSSTTKTA